MLILKHPHQYLCYLTCILPRYVQLLNLFSELLFAFFSPKNFFFFLIEHVLFFFLQMIKILYIILPILFQTTLLFCSITLFFRWKFSLLFIQIMLNFVEDNLLPYYMSIFCRKHALDVYSYFTFMSEWLYIILNYTCVLEHSRYKNFYIKKNVSCWRGARNCIDWTTSQLDKMNF